MFTLVRRHPLDTAVWSALVLGSIALVACSIAGLTSYGWTELAGFITGALCVWLTVKQSTWNFPIGLANALIFVWLFVTFHLYADMAINVVFVVLTLYGWFNWLRGGPGKTALKVRHARRTELLVGVAVVVALTLVLRPLLASIADIAPWRDALTFALSIVAQYFLDRKVFANWAFWIVADVVYVQLYFQKDLALTGVLYGLFLAMCLRALVEWHRSLKANAVVVPPSSEGEAVLQEVA